MAPGLLAGGARSGFAGSMGPQVKERYFRNRETIRQLLQNPATELMLPVRKGENHALFREVALVIEHTAYHTGQLMIIERLLGLHSS